MDRGAPYVDVRTTEEFEAGHPAGAHNLPISEPDFALLAGACFDKRAPIVLGCRSGHRSVLAAKALEAEGFTDVYEQLAGWETRSAASRTSAGASRVCRSKKAPLASARSRQSKRRQNDEAWVRLLDGRRRTRHGT